MEPSNPKRDTNKLDSSHKEHLDKMMKKMTRQQMQHAANHIQNCADDMQEHNDSAVTFNDFQKAKKSSNESYSP
jgi:hypothetical protein